MERKLTNYERATLSLVLTKLAKEDDFDGVQYANSIAGSIGIQDSQIFFRSFFNNENKIVVGFSVGDLTETDTYDKLLDSNDKFELREKSSLFTNRDLTTAVKYVLFDEGYVLNKCLDTIGQLIFKPGVEITNVAPEMDTIHILIKNDDRLPSFDFKVIDNNFVLIARILADVNDSEIESLISGALIDNIYDFIDKVQYMPK